MTISYMLDTNAVSFVLENQARVAQRLLSFKPSAICVSAITVGELGLPKPLRQCGLTDADLLGEPTGADGLGARHALDHL
jgi:hypothetical protein